MVLVRSRWHAGKMPSDIGSLIIARLVTTPDWIRRDLSSKDESLRNRAEEALAAIIEAAITEQPIA
jgi:hypothetical protein